MGSTYAVLHIAFRDSNWITDNCIVNYVTELIPLSK
jgi:hypothetical protein